MIHYLEEIPISEAVIKDFTNLHLFCHCKRDFLDQLIVVNCFRVSWVIICIHTSSYFEISV